MERVPKRRANPRSTCVLSLASRSAGSSWAVAAENSGAICRHGPHDGAQKSTSKGTSERSPSAGKFCAVRTAGRPLRRAMQRPHLASADILASGTRFVAPPAAQPTIFVSGFDIERLAAVSRSLARHALLVTAGLTSLPRNFSRWAGDRSATRELSHDVDQGARRVPERGWRRPTDLLESARDLHGSPGKLLCLRPDRVR